MTLELARLGWDGTFAAAYAARGLPDGDHQPGRVLRADRGVCTVITSAGTVRASLAGALLAAAAADPASLPCAGDWVVVRWWPDGRTTADVVLPRRTAVVRRTADKDATGQVLAANVDTVAVVEPIDPTPELGRVGRLLALAWQSGAQPLVVLSKADLAPDPDAVAAQVAEATAGVRVVPVSAEHDAASMAALRPEPGRTLALLGPSGAGKSTIVNAMAGAAVMSVQQIRRRDGKGRHTTTYRELVLLAGGGAVLDTPGLPAPEAGSPLTVLA